jgi:hypothetical protein
MRSPMWVCCVTYVAYMHDAGIEELDCCMHVYVAVLMVSL